jgi:hypothetical protein
MRLQNFLLDVGVPERTHDDDPTHARHFKKARPMREALLEIASQNG